MVKTLLLVAAGSLGTLGACATDNSTSLKDLQSTFGDTTIEVVAKSQVSVLLHVKGDGCPTLSGDVVAKFDGEVMVASGSAGGYDVDATGCYPIGFTFNKFPADKIGARERSSGTAQITLEDRSAAWTIAPTQLFGNDLEIDEAASRLVWPNVDRIVTARIVPAVDVRIDGNSMYYPRGTQIQFADAYAHPLATSCNGPQLCTIDLERNRAFGKTLPQ